MNSGDDDSEGLMALKQTYEKFVSETKVKLDNYDLKFKLLMPLVQPKNEPKGTGSAGAGTANSGED